MTFFANNCACMVYLNDSDDEMLRASEIEAPLLCVRLLYIYFACTHFNVFERAKKHFFLHLLFLGRSHSHSVRRGMALLRWHMATKIRWSWRYKQRRKKEVKWNVNAQEKGARTRSDVRCGRSRSTMARENESANEEKKERNGKWLAKVLACLNDFCLYTQTHNDIYFDVHFFHPSHLLIIHFVDLCVCAWLASSLVLFVVIWNTSLHFNLFVVVHLLNATIYRDILLIFVVHFVIVVVDVVHSMCAHLFLFYFFIFVGCFFFLLLLLPVAIGKYKI